MARMVCVCVCVRMSIGVTYFNFNFEFPTSNQHIILRFAQAHSKVARYLAPSTVCFDFVPHKSTAHTV